MQWIRIRALFESNNISLAEELLCDLFFTLGIKGVECQVPLPVPEDSIADPDDIALNTYSVIGYIPATKSAKDILTRISEGAARLDDFGIRITLETENVDPEDWSESWKAFFDVFKLSEKIVIKPVWKAYSGSPDEIIIEIDPGMAFGAGTHATTAMCIQMIETYLKPGDLFLDVGTGSGILMITAAKLNASEVHGLDVDAVAIEVAHKNLEQNQIIAGKYFLELAGLPDMTLSDRISFDVICANILAPVIIDLAPFFLKRMKPGGILITSGIIDTAKRDVVLALEAQGLSILEIRSVEEWIAIAAVKPQP